MRSVFPRIPRNESARVARQWFTMAAIAMQAVPIYERWRRVLLRHVLRERFASFREALYSLRWIGHELYVLGTAGIRSRPCRLTSPDSLDDYDSRYHDDGRRDEHETYPDGLSNYSGKSR